MKDELISLLLPQVASPDETEALTLDPERRSDLQLLTSGLENVHGAFSFFILEESLYLTDKEKTSTETKTLRCFFHFICEPGDKRFRKLRDHDVLTPDVLFVKCRWSHTERTNCCRRV